MDDGTGLAEALLGLDGFRVLAVDEDPAEVVVTVETVAGLVGCGRCGVRAQAQDRMPVHIRDLACFGRPARLVWIKRRWRCVEPDCDARNRALNTGHRHPSSSAAPWAPSTGSSATTSTTRASHQPRETCRDVQDPNPQEDLGGRSVSLERNTGRA